jgi:outer membrane protein OmpA-like peptidoglycan-associated protein
MNSSGGDADTTNYTEQAAGSAVSSKVWEITFKSGSADLTPESEAVMRELKDSTAITGLAIQIDGYTDNSGPDSINIPLSQRRAETVRDWLHSAAPVNFPKNRFRPEGHGSQDPVASNATADGRAKNRRTVITLLGN